MRRFLLATVMAMCAAALTGCDLLGEGYSGLELTGARFARDFQLTDADGREHTLADWRGKYVMVFFGYGYCPEVCPAVLIRAAEVRNALGADRDRIQVIAVTLDPERDSPADFRDYARAFDPSFVGLWGTPDRIRKTANEFHVYYEKVPSGKSYTISHTALTYVYDPAGKVRLALTHEETTQQMIADLRRLMDKVAQESAQARAG